MSNFLEIFLERLKTIQGKRSVSAFARELGIPQKSLDNYVKGLRKPSVELILLVCSKCGVSADYLLGLSDSPHGGQGGNSATNSPGAAVGAGASVRTVPPPAPPPSGQCADCATVAALRDVIRALSPR